MLMMVMLNPKHVGKMECPIKRLLGERKHKQNIEGKKKLWLYSFVPNPFPS
jgi:hypothetical protein